MLSHSHFAESKYETHWVIEIPSDSEDGKREEFVTVHVLSHKHRRVLCGRATIVWAAVKREDAMNGNIENKARIMMMMTYCIVC